MNEISFTGIYNLKIQKKYNTVWGTYLPPNHAPIRTDDIPLKHGEKHYKRIIIDCDVTDDEAGQDFTEYLDELKLCTPKDAPEIKYKNPDNPNHIKIYMDRFDVNDELGKVTESSFKLNDFDVTLCDRSILPVYTIMAAITKKLQKLQDISKEKCEILQLVNESVHKKAMDFIENIM